MGRNDDVAKERRRSFNEFLKETKMPSWDEFGDLIKEFPYTDPNGKIDHTACFGLLSHYAMKAIFNLYKTRSVASNLDLALDKNERESETQKIESEQKINNAMSEVFDLHKSLEESKAKESLLRSIIAERDNLIRDMAKDLSHQILSKEAKSATAKPKRPGRPKTNRG